MRSNSQIPEPTDGVVVAAFYRFVSIEDPPGLRAVLSDQAQRAGILGTVLIAPEGINGTIAGSAAAVRTMLEFLEADPRFQGLTPRFSHAQSDPFHRLKVRLKQEIVTLGVPAADPNVQVGTYVEPADWNALIADPGVVVIDVRNDYEVGIGSFEGAVDPQLVRFSDFDRWLEEHPDLEGRPIAMFCTGGIRCEKASSLMLHRGATEVYHLKGGILRYLEEVPVESSRWRGACFVFDERVSVGHGLEVGTHVLCRGCRRPLVPATQDHPSYEAGVRCGACPPVSAEVLASRRERVLQERLAHARGEKHVGAQR